MLLVLLGICAFAFSYGINLLVIKYGKHASVNSRSNHKKPTAQGGGIGILISYALTSFGLFLWVRSQIFNQPGDYYGIFVQDEFLQLYSFWLPLCLLALISLVNDNRHIPSALRLLIHAIAVFYGVLAFTSSLDTGDWLQAGYFHLIPLWGWVAVALGWMWFINLYNFMDGINGILAVETLSILIAYAIAPQILTDNVILIGATCGFLILNFPNARLFAGDVGSIPLGFITGGMCIQQALERNWACALIPPLYFIIDASLTLILRIVRREKIWHAHSQHFYQQAVRKGFSHKRVTLTIAALNAVLIGLSVAAQQFPLPSFLFAALAVMLCLWHFRKPE